LRNLAWLTDIMELQFAGAIIALVADLGRKHYGRYRALLVGGVAVAFLVASIVEFLSNWSQVLSGPLLLQPIQSIFSSLYSVDRLGVLVILTILVVGIAVAVYCMTSFSPSVNSGPFFALLMLLVTSSIGVVSSGDLLTLFLFWEGISVAAFGLVSFERRDVSLEAAMKYFFIAGAGSLVYLYGAALIYSVTGSIRLSALSIFSQQSNPVAIFGVVMLIVGLGVEAAIFPFHTWLPDAYGSAPALTGALHGRVVNETLVFAILKIVQPLIPADASGSLVHGIQLTLVAFAVMTMFVGNFGAMGQSNLRRMLAFSSIAQIGYMLAAIATFTPLGLIAATFQIWNHGLVKSNFFMLTGINRWTFEETELDRMKGLGKQRKFLGALYTASSLAMVGAPPFGMFWSELLIIESMLSVGNVLFLGLAVIFLFNVFLSIAYYFRIINNVVLSPSENTDHTSPLPYSGSICSPVALLSLSLFTGMLPSIILSMVA
jgi:proton-translocating NADH-quinone oxidoreductase chain N